MHGYNENFIPGFRIPLPEFSEKLSELIVRNNNLHDRYVTNYPNYSIVMRSDQRAAAFSALNIDQDSIDEHDVNANEGKKPWTYDYDIGEDYQLNNDYYKYNPWDRGHNAMRKNTAWGNTSEDAIHASKQTYYWSNSTLQHKNFNQDEWQGLEMWIQNDLNAKEGRISSFALPIFKGYLRHIKPAGRRAAYVPSGFCKVIAYCNREGKPETRAFVMLQDADAISNRNDQSKGQIIENGRSIFNYQRYQTSTTLVEHLTGVVFPQVLKDTNPAYFYNNQATTEERERRRVFWLPEMIEVDDADEVVSNNDERVEVRDDEIEVYVSAAMPDPEGRDDGHEWVSIANFSGEAVNIAGWELSDAKGRKTKISDATIVSGTHEIAPGGSIVVKKLSPMKLPNQGGVIILKNTEGQRVERVNYHEEDVSKGKPVNFYYQPSMSTV